MSNDRWVEGPWCPNCGSNEITSYESGAGVDCWVCDDCDDDQLAPDDPRIWVRPAIVVDLEAHHLTRNAAACSCGVKFHGDAPIHWIIAFRKHRREVVEQAYNPNV